MKLTSQQIEFLIEELSRDIIIKLMDDWNCDMVKAMEMYYNSETFERLTEPVTGLYYQSAGYVYDFLQNELRTGKVT